jgi:hypothetical protein
MDIVLKLTLIIFLLKMSPLVWVMLFIKIDYFVFLILFLCLFFMWLLFCYSFSNPGQMAHNGTLWLLSRFFQFPMITDICVYICSIPCSFSFLCISSPFLIWKMDITLEKLKRYFPALFQNAITKIYRARCERLRLLMNHRISWRYSQANWSKSPIIKWVF